MTSRLSRAAYRRRRPARVAKARRGRHRRHRGDAPVRPMEIAAGARVCPPSNASRSDRCATSFLVILPARDAAQSVSRRGLLRPDPDARRHVPVLRKPPRRCGAGIRGHDADDGPAGEDDMVTGAIRTGPESCPPEIMVIALNEVADQPFVPRAGHPRRRWPWSLPSWLYGGGRRHRQDGRRRAEPDRGPYPESAGKSAGSWSPGCPNCSRRSPWWVRWRCSGWAATFLLVGSDRLGWARPERPGTPRRGPGLATPLSPSVASSPGWSAPGYPR